MAHASIMQAKGWLYTSSCVHAQVRAPYMMLVVHLSCEV